MTLLPNRLLKLGLFSIALGTLAACGASSPVKSEASQQQAQQAGEIYEVHHDDGRIYVFYDRKLAEEFMSLGETPFRLTRIGAGPNNETMVFGLTKHDKKKRAGIPAVDLYDGKAKPAEDFYAEIYRHGRIYVFDNFEDMQPVRQFGHPNLFYMQIGAGPKHETVVFVLNEHNKKKKPLELIEKFNKLHDINS